MHNHKMGTPSPLHGEMIKASRGYHIHKSTYNPHLSMLLGCHVNIEYCANMLGSIKYIHKYLMLPSIFAQYSIFTWQPRSMERWGLSTVQICLGASSTFAQ